MPIEQLTRGVWCRGEQVISTCYLPAWLAPSAPNRDFRAIKADEADAAVLAMTPSVPGRQAAFFHDSKWVCRDERLGSNLRSGPDSCSGCGRPLPSVEPSRRGACSRVGHSSGGKAEQPQPGHRNCHNPLVLNVLR